MSDSTTYIIVTAESLEALATAVEAKKQLGYVVSGAPYVAITGYAQDMILASALSPIDFPEAVVDITSAYIGNRTKESGNPIYYVGDKVEPEEYSATLELKSGATRPLFQDDFYVSPREISSTNDTTVKVIYKWEKGFEDAVTIASKAVELTSIVVQDMPRKTTYVVGQTFTGYDGLEVTALYNNNSLKRLPAGSYTVTGNVNTSTAGTYIVTVSYTEGSITKTTTFNIEVVENTPVALEVLGDAKLQYVGKEIDATGLTFKATMLDESIKDVTEDVTSDAPGALTDIGTKKVMFSYTENGVTASGVKYFNVTTRKPVALTMTGEFATQYINTAVNLAGLAFKAVYDNGDVADVTSSTAVTPSTWGSTVGIQTVVFTYSASGVTLTLTKSVEVKENVGPVPKAPNYLKYSSTTPFKFAPVEWVDSEDEEEGSYQPAGADTLRWDGTLQYHIGSEPSENTEWVDFPAEGTACDWIEVGGSRSGEVIVPTGTLAKIYINCDATTEDMEEAFGDIPAGQWFDHPVLGTCYGAYSNGIVGTGASGLPLLKGTIFVIKNFQGENNWMISLSDDDRDASSGKSFALLSNGQWRTKINGSWTTVSGIHEFSITAPAPGLASLTIPGIGDYTVGQGNDKLTKIFSFNEPFKTTEPNLYIRGIGNTTIVGEDEMVTFQTKTIGSSSPQISLSGKLMALFDCENPESATLPSDKYGVQHLFIDDENLTDASGLVLPSTLADPLDEDDVWSGCLSGLFYNCTSLTTAPVLPATELTGNCYACMFEYCESLETPPVLPATTLAAGCYASMFSDCSSLITAPDLPAINLPDGKHDAWTGTAFGVYSHMFENCTSLTEVSAISATTLGTYCCQNMFAGCTSLEDAPELPATILADFCYSGMFQNCTSLTTAPVLPAITLTDNCYSAMFRGCTSLEALPALPATTLAKHCYNSMFEDCHIRLSKEEEEGSVLYRIPSEGSASYSTGDLPLFTMFRGTEHPTVFGWMDDSGTPVLYSGDSWTGYVSFIPPTPQGSNYVKYSSTTPFKFAPVEYEDPIQQGTLRWDGTLQYHVGSEPSGDADWTNFPEGDCDWIEAEEDNGNYNIYIRGKGNTTIVGTDEVVIFQTQAIEGEADPEVSLSGKLMALFNYEDPENAVLPDDKYGVQYLFASDRNLTDASGLILPSKLSDPYVDNWGDENGCLSYLFWDCASLTTAPELPATTLTINCYDNMFQSCTSLTTAPELPATELADWCYNRMFQGCTSLAAAPELPATELKEGCYNYMFQGCTSIKLSETQTGEYQTPYRIPKEGTGTTATDALNEMFTDTGGTFTGAPEINTTYYTSNTVV